MSARCFCLSLALWLAFAGATGLSGELFLRRSLAEISEQPVDLSTNTAHYKPMFGRGDSQSRIVKGVTCFGQLTVDPGGSSKPVSYSGEEQIFFVLEGTGLLNYGQQTVPISRDDFMYLPVNVEHAVSNPRERPVRLLVMGFRIPPGELVSPTPKLMLANADQVRLQVLGQHGPTTQFKLLMGTTGSTRDRLAAAHRVNSLFLMDFAGGGTNIPHRHIREEEIYFVLRGRGEMVAGAGANGEEIRHPAKEGDAFYFAPGTLVGFYSGAKEGAEHDLILAVRWSLPGTKATD
jgi:mannose-6-phosphate isomerase-like protein (cupin superfamily)